MKRLVLTAAILAVTYAPLVSSVSRETMWDTVFLAAYPNYETARRASVPERVLNDGFLHTDPYSDYDLDARAIHYLHEKRRHERRNEPFRPSGVEFSGMFVVADSDSEVLELVAGYWCGTPLKYTNEFAVEELRIRAEHIPKRHRAANVADEAVERFFGS